jgi:nicotinamide-nucleotide amidase
MSRALLLTRPRSLLVKGPFLSYNTPMPLEKEVACLLIKHHKTLSLAESCSGGLLANRLTNIPGSSRFFKLGLITYSNEAKTKLLKVPVAVLKKYGAVSPQTAERMAQGVRRLARTDFAIAITGIAGPGGGTTIKPVGLVYIAISSKTKILCVKNIFKGNRLRIKDQAATQALRLLLPFLHA